MSLRSQTPKTVSAGASAAHTNQNDTHTQQNDTTIPSLVSELRVTTHDFDRLERALLERESRLVSAIQEKDNEIASLKVKDSIHSLDKLNLESQLKEFRNEGTKVVVEVKKEENVDSDSSDAGKCMHCLEMKNELEKEKGVSESLRDRNMQLEFEKSKLLEEKKKWDDQRGVVEDLMKRIIELEAEKCGLLEEKKKWDAAKRGIDGSRKGENRGADEASVECRKRKFIELSERVSRLERETAENDKLISLDDDEGDGGGGDGDGDDDGDGNNTEENKKIQIDDSVEKDAVERNENVGHSSRDSTILIIPSKDGGGVTAASVPEIPPPAAPEFQAGPSQPQAQEVGVQQFYREFQQFQLDTQQCHEKIMLKLNYLCMTIHDAHPQLMSYPEALARAEQYDRKKKLEKKTQEELQRQQVWRARTEEVTSETEDDESSEDE